MSTEYTYDLARGWREVPPRRARLPQTDALLGEQLFDAGYTILADSQAARCGVGGFSIWQQQRGPTAGPRYAIEICQTEDIGVVWIDTLPALWEWLRLYGPIGTVIQHADGDEERVTTCAECLAETEAGEDADVWECPHDTGDTEA